MTTRERRQERRHLELLVATLVAADVARGYFTPSYEAALVRAQMVQETVRRRSAQKQTKGTKR